MGNHKNIVNKSKKFNPMIKQQETERKIKKYMDEAKNAGIKYGSIVNNLILVHVLYHKSTLDTEQIKHIITEMMKVADKIPDSITISEVIDNINNQGFGISEDTLTDIYPGVAAYLPSEDKKD